MKRILVKNTYNIYIFLIYIIFYKIFYISVLKFLVIPSYLTCQTTEDAPSYLVQVNFVQIFYFPLDVVKIQDKILKVSNQEKPTLLAMDYQGEHHLISIRKEQTQSSHFGYRGTPFRESTQ